jgi:hypothetical protein
MYMFNREWGVMATLPYVNRAFTTDTGPPSGVQTFNSRDFGDLEVMAMYTGFSQDLFCAGLELKAHRHMLRHASAYALANKGHDTRAIQGWLVRSPVDHIDGRLYGPGAEPV